MVMSSRQAAVMMEQQWYTPDKACPYCGKMAMKRVANGECSGCKERPAKQHVKPPEGVIMRACEAKRLGYTMYYTGRQCHRGHDDYRYVSNRQCIRCHANKKSPVLQ